MKISKIKPLADVALWAVLIGGIVFALGFGISLHLVKGEVKELFGDARLLESAAKAEAKNGQISFGYVQGIMQAVKAQAGAAEQNDDITMLVIRYQ